MTEPLASLKPVMSGFLIAGVQRAMLGVRFTHY